VRFSLEVFHIRVEESKRIYLRKEFGAQRVVGLMQNNGGVVFNTEAQRLRGLVAFATRSFGVLEIWSFSGIFS